MDGQDSAVCNLVERQPPLVVEWGEPHDPVPVQIVRPTSPRTRLGVTEESPPWLWTGPIGQPFDFCSHIRRLADDISRRCPSLSHLKTGRILFSFSQARNARRSGLQASVTPLRFAGGKETRWHRGIEYRVQQWKVGGQEMLYLMTFYLPRFLNQTFDEKFVTLFHELYHISPNFDGDLRRHEGRCSMHTRSQREYDERMAELARSYLASDPDPKLHAFLRLNHAQLEQRHKRVVGVCVSRPKIIPVAQAAV